MGRRRRIPRSNCRRLEYDLVKEAMFAGGEVIEFVKSRWEKRVWLQVWQRRMSRERVSFGGGFSVKGGRELAGENQR